MVSRTGITLAVMSALLAGAYGEHNITSDTYFYGQSESVYPSPIGQGTGDWSEAYTKATALVAKMTLEEKNNLTYGDTPTNGCSGIIQAIPRLGFPGMCLQDAGNGVRYTDFVNSYPSGMHIGASWNKSLAYDRGYYMGGEFRKKGVQVALGPVVGPLGRMASGGRNWEGFANDPYLSGSLAAETVEGVQYQGVITSLKHFIGNEQELYRNPTNSTEKQMRESISSNIDDTTMHELYLWPFVDAIRAGTGNVMCSYNRINNSHACQNSKILNGLLKTELGFNGFVVTDWLAQHSGVASALAGLDMAMPDGESFWGNNFTSAFNNGSVPMSRLDDMATRIIAAWYKMGQDNASYPTPGKGMPFNISEPHNFVNALDSKAKSTIFNGAVEGHVLVKNVNNSLPLHSPRLISVFGYDAKVPDQYMPPVNPPGNNPWQFGYEAALFQVDDAFSTTIVDEPYIDQVALNGTLSVGGGSGANSGPYISSPLDALQQRAYVDNTVVMWDTTDSPSNMGLMEASDACLVFINAFASEGLDRAGIHDNYSDALVNIVANTCSNTVVIIHNAGLRLVDQFVDHPNVTAIVFAHLPGQDSGRALVSLLYGDDNFSGKLPYTVAKNESDYNVLYHAHAVTPYGLFPQSNFTEGLYIDYRDFDAKNITPRYEFGFGLSYTKFSFSGLQTSVKNKSTPKYPSGPIQQGGHIDLWENIANVTATVHNIGSVVGAEVAQLYVGIPGRPIKQLRGFEKVEIAPGSTATVQFPLTRRDLSVWDVGAQKWTLESGKYMVYIGSSSRNLPLDKTIKLSTI